MENNNFFMDHSGSKDEEQNVQEGKIEVCNPLSLECDVPISGPTPTTTLLESLTVYDPMRMIKGNPVEYPENRRDLCYLKAYNKHICNGLYIYNICNITTYGNILWLYLGYFISIDKFITNFTGTGLRI